MSLPDALELAASALPAQADGVRDANGDPVLLLETLDRSGAVAVLQWLLEHEPEPASELAFAWADSDEGSRALQEIEDGTLPKPGKKALRRALHRLRSRGVEIAASASGNPVVARLPDIDESLEAGLVTPLDPRGSRMAYLLESNPTGGARLFEMVLDDVRGIVEFRAYSAGRSRVRSFLKDIASRGPSVTLEVEPGQVRALLARAAAAQPADRPAPRAFAENRSQLQLESAEPTPGEQAEAELGPGVSERSTLEHAAELVRKGTLGPWPPSMERLRELGDTAREELGGKVIVSGATREERSREVLSGIAASLFVESFAEVTASRLREAAYVLWKGDAADDARACLGAAAAFAAGSEENPVALAFVEAMLAPLLAQLDQEREGESGEEESLIVEP